MTRCYVECAQRQNRGEASENVPAIFLQGVRRIDRRSEATAGARVASLDLCAAGLILATRLTSATSLSFRLQYSRARELE